MWCRAWPILRRHCDGARAYPSLLERLLQDRRYVFADQVNHANHQWTRFHRHVVEGCPGVVRLRVTAGTNLIESWWHVVKSHCIPPEVSSNVAALETYVLVQIYREWNTGDPVIELGAAVRAYMQAMSYDPYANDPHLGNVDPEEDAGEQDPA
jgi:hypothetical protein